MAEPETCAACGATALVPRWRFAAPAVADGLVPTTLAFGSALGDVVGCARCGHGQVAPMPRAAVLDSAYADAASTDYVAEAAGQRATAGRVLGAIERHAPARGALLDVGCWLGYLLADARDRGWGPVAGVEPSRFAAAYARDTLDLEIHDTLPDRRFDAIVLADVLEHLPDPGATLTQLRARLAPGGVLALALPDAGSRVARVLGRRWWSVLPTHVQYFTRASVRALLTGQGFAVLGVETAPKTFTAGYYAGRVAGYSPAAGRALTSALRAAGLAERPWAPDFRDRMLVLAR